MESNSYSEYATGLRIQGKSELIDTRKENNSKCVKCKIKIIYVFCS